MIQTAELAHTPIDDAVTLVDNLPHGKYTDLYQPPFQREGLIESVHELQNTHGVTTRENIISLQRTLTAVAEGVIADPILITARCAEPVDASTSIETLVAQSTLMVNIAKRGLGKVIVILRNRGQNGKPRSSEYQLLDDDTKVLSYMGDAVNGCSEIERHPDPTRLVAAAVQARDLEAGLTQELGYHVPAAHEALLLAYEQSFIREDEDGKLWSHSGDLLWVGDRTRGPQGPHVEMLSKIENPIGVKIGPTTQPEEIEALQTRLNPLNIPGKLVLMLRVGLQNEATIDALLDAIKLHAPRSIILYDIHGSTVTDADGVKIRAVNRIVAEIEQLAAMCAAKGLRLHGMHLESQTDDSRLECVQELGEKPTHEGGVDPQLNNVQSLNIYQRVGRLFMKRTAA